MTTDLDYMDEEDWNNPIQTAWRRFKETHPKYEDKDLGDFLEFIDEIADFKAELEILEQDIRDEEEGQRMYEEGLKQRLLDEWRKSKGYT